MDLKEPHSLRAIQYWKEKKKKIIMLPFFANVFPSKPNARKYNCISLVLAHSIKQQGLYVKKKIFGNAVYWANGRQPNLNTKPLLKTNKY